jgi:citrate lyase subunit beta/citryl-CoA lyase
LIARSWLFAPGDNARLLEKAFEVGADQVILDLEDGVVPANKDEARSAVADRLATAPAWVRVNEPRSELCARDLDAVGAAARGIRMAKVESAEDAEWVAERAPGLPIVCGIESARGIFAAREIAAVGAVENLSLGGADLTRELRCGDGPMELLASRSALVLASSEAGIDPPIDRVYMDLKDNEGLASEAAHASALGFGGKSAVHPRQLAVINVAFAPGAAEVEWAEAVLAASRRAGGGPAQLDDGTFVDAPVYRRAADLLAIARDRDD